MKKIAFIAQFLCVLDKDMESHQRKYLTTHGRCP